MIATDDTVMRAWTLCGRESVEGLRPLVGALFCHPSIRYETDYAVLQGFRMLLPTTDNNYCY